MSAGALEDSGQWTVVVVDSGQDNPRSLDDGGNLFFCLIGPAASGPAQQHASGTCTGAS